MQKIIHIEATNLPDLFFQTLYKAVEVGRDFTVDTGSFAGQKRKEFDFVVLHAKCPGVGELLPKLNPALNLDNPVADNYMDNYLPYLMTGEEQPGEAYTYGQRICAALLRDLHKHQQLLIEGLQVDWHEDSPQYLNDNIFWLNEDTMELHVNQMELMIWTYKNKGYRNNQMIMQVGKPSDMSLLDPPCLRHIDTRIQNNLEKEFKNIKDLYIKLHQDEYDETGWEGIALVEDTLEFYIQVITNEFQNNFDKPWTNEEIEKELEECKVYELHFYPYFRSWDLWGGLPANLAAIELMKQYCAEQIGVENGEIIATSKGLHLYNYIWEIAETVRGRSADEFKTILMDNKSEQDFRDEQKMPYGNHISRG